MNNNRDNGDNDDDDDQESMADDHDHDHDNDDDNEDQESMADEAAPQILTFLSSISMPFYLLHQQVCNDHHHLGQDDDDLLFPSSAVSDKMYKNVKNILKPVLSPAEC